jgi:rhomboid protease GluP
MNMLSSYYNFNIIEILHETNNSLWGLLKSDENINEMILFKDKWNSQDDYLTISSYIRNKYSNIDTKVHIVNINKNEKLMEFAMYKAHPYLIDNICFDLILIDEDLNKVVHNTETASEIAVFINNIITYSTGNIDKHEKKDKTYATNVLIAINVLIFLVTAFLSGSIIDIDGRVLLLFGAKQNDLINNGEYYRLLTAMFLHGGLMHIGFNMYALKSLGPFIERIYGRTRFLTIYFFGGLISSLFSYLFSEGMSVGASGAIFALLGCALVYGIQMKNKVGKDFLSNIIQVIGINLILGFTVSNIDNYGHIGGLVGGIIGSFLISVYSKR